MRYFVHLAYDGSQYHGWQIQKNAHSVQAEIEDCFRKLSGNAVKVTGCGRTDTGVHAKSFYLHFDIEDKLPMDMATFLYKCNAILPRDIVFYELFPVPADAHARFSALSRTYTYYIHRHKSPFRRQYSFFHPFDLDISGMNRASEILFEYRDFSAFSKSKTQTKTNDCSITEAWWEERDGQYIFHITADRFLRNMVRAIVGTLLEIGTGKRAVEDLHRIIASKDRSMAGMSVPGNALFLSHIAYPPEIFSQCCDS